MKYPECEKMQGVKDKSQAIGEFLEWLGSEKEVFLAKWELDEYEDEYITRFLYSAEKLLAEFFNIDLNKVEQERRQILSELKENQGV